MMKTPVILARSDRRTEPGAISIMQRDHPLSPRTVVTSPGGLLPTPSELPTKQRDDHKVFLISSLSGFSTCIYIYIYMHAASSQESL